MKVCKSCGLSPPEVGFSKTRARGKVYDRGTCNRCNNIPKSQRAAPVAPTHYHGPNLDDLRKERAGEVPPDQRPTPPHFESFPATPPPPVDPLKDAYVRWEDRAASKAALAREKALLQENLRLKAEREQYLQIKSPTVIVYDKAKEMRSDAIACALLSDWHVEEEVDKTVVHGLNEYNLEVAKTRAEHCFKNLLRLTDIMARDSKITTIHLSLLGDFFSGHIHEELMSSTLLNPADAAGFVLDLLVSGITFLLKNSPYTIIGDAIPGNHGRMTKQVWISDPTGTSLETFIYRALVGHFHGNERVQINVANRAMVYRDFFERFKLRLIHGYEMKYGGGVGGITIPVRKAIAQWDMSIPATVTGFGHFHQRIDGGNFLGNGSLIGYGPYSQFIKANYEEPQQMFFLIHARGGGQKSIVAPIWLSDARTQPHFDDLAPYHGP